jgi:hypothetical protein
VRFAASQHRFRSTVDRPYLCEWRVAAVSGQVGNITAEEDSADALCSAVRLVLARDPFVHAGRITRLLPGQNCGFILGTELEHRPRRVVAPVYDILEREVPDPDERG